MNKPFKSTKIKSQRALQWDSFFEKYGSVMKKVPLDKEKDCRLEMNSVGKLNHSSSDTSVSKFKQKEQMDDCDVSSNMPSLRYYDLSEVQFWINTGCPPCLASLGYVDRPVDRFVNVESSESSVVTAEYIKQSMQMKNKVPCKINSKLSKANHLTKDSPNNSHLRNPKKSPKTQNTENGKEDNVCIRGNQQYNVQKPINRSTSETSRKSHQTKETNLRCKKSLVIPLSASSLEKEDKKSDAGPFKKIYIPSLSGRKTFATRLEKREDNSLAKSNSNSENFNSTAQNPCQVQYLLVSSGESSSDVKVGAKRAKKRVQNNKKRTSIDLRRRNNSSESETRLKNNTQKIEPGIIYELAADCCQKAYTEPNNGSNQVRTKHICQKSRRSRKKYLTTSTSILRKNINELSAGDLAEHDCNRSKITHDQIKYLIVNSSSDDECYNARWRKP